MRNEPCPDCKQATGDVEQDDELHTDACPRVNTLGQIGPPWLPGPWPEWCHFPMTYSDGAKGPCMGPKGHTDKHRENYTGPEMNLLECEIQGHAWKVVWQPQVGSDTYTFVGCQREGCEAVGYLVP